MSFRYYSFGIGKIYNPGKCARGDDGKISWHANKPFYMTSEYFCYRDGSPHPLKMLFCPVEPKAQPPGALMDVNVKNTAVNFLNKWNATRNPVFLAVGFHKPHVNFVFPKRFLRLHPLEDVAVTKHPNVSDSTPPIAYNPSYQLRGFTDTMTFDIPGPLTPFPLDLQRLIRQHYYAAVSHIDDLVGQVLQALVDSGKAGETVVGLIGDHGWAMGANGLYAKFGNSEAATRVPWILHDPDRHPDLSGFRYVNPMTSSKERSYPHDTVPEPVELLDLFPTLVDLAGLTSLSKCREADQTLCTEGQSRAKVSKKPRRGQVASAVSQYPRPALTPMRNSDMPKMEFIKYMGYTIRTMRHRYTKWVEYDAELFQPNFDRVVAEELYDHEVDSEETDNLIGRASLAHVRDGLRTLLHQRLTHI